MRRDTKKKKVEESFTQTHRSFLIAMFVSVLFIIMLFTLDEIIVDCSKDVVKPNDYWEEMGR